MTQSGEHLRKLHNECKRELIQQWVRRGDKVLDCGCGRGGDLHKWKHVGAVVFAIDPDDTSLQEAENRAHEMHLGVWFLGTGTIVQGAFAGPFDVVCYNFSLHYIFENEKTYKESIRAIACALRKGGHLIGVTPEKARIEAITDATGYFKDGLGNEIQVCRGSRRLHVRLVDGPFYADGGREEPILDANMLVHDLELAGLELVRWEPMLLVPNGHVSDIYSRFVFKKVSD